MAQPLSLHFSSYFLRYSESLLSRLINLQREIELGQPMPHKGTTPIDAAKIKH